MKLHKLSPILWTYNLKDTIRFYESVLGFSGKSNFPNFVSLTRGDVELMFVVPQEEPEDCKDTDQTSAQPTPMLTGSLFILADEVDTLWEKVKEKAAVKTSLADREYLMRDFSILDNNGYELVFGKDLSR